MVKLIIQEEKNPTKQNKRKKNTTKNTRFRNQKVQSFGKSSVVILEVSNPGIGV
jgi:hypothetical protein